MTDCWKQQAAERPEFKSILIALSQIYLSLRPVGAEKNNIKNNKNKQAPLSNAKTSGNKSNGKSSNIILNNDSDSIPENLPIANDYDAGIVAFSRSSETGSSGLIAASKSISRKGSDKMDSKHRNSNNSSNESSNNMIDDDETAHLLNKKQHLYGVNNTVFEYGRSHEDTKQSPISHMNSNLFPRNSTR